MKGRDGGREGRISPFSHPSSHLQIYWNSSFTSVYFVTYLEEFAALNFLPLPKGQTLRLCPRRREPILWHRAKLLGGEGAVRGAGAWMPQSLMKVVDPLNPKNSHAQAYTLILSITLRAFIRLPPPLPPSPSKNHQESVLKTTPPPPRHKAW